MLSSLAKKTAKISVEIKISNPVSFLKFFIVGRVAYSDYANFPKPGLKFGKIMIIYF